MPFYRFNGGMVHIKLSGKQKPPKACVARLEDGQQCCGISTLLCDWKLEAGGTCDAPLCEEHGVQVGDDLHLCPIHDKRRREAEPELF
jgi:hypothetical protein